MRLILGIWRYVMLMPPNLIALHIDLHDAVTTASLSDLTDIIIKFLSPG